MSRADGKAERDRIEAERAVREAIAAKQAAAQSSSVPKRPAETTAERHRRIAEKTREAFAELDEIDPPKRKPVTSYSETENPRTAVSRSRTEVQPRQASSQSNRNSTPRPANRTAAKCKIIFRASDNFFKNRFTNATDKRKRKCSKKEKRTIDYCYFCGLSLRLRLFGI